MSIRRLHTTELVFPSAALVFNVCDVSFVIWTNEILDIKWAPRVLWGLASLKLLRHFYDEFP